MDLPLKAKFIRETIPKVALRTSVEGCNVEDFGGELKLFSFHVYYLLSAYKSINLYFA